MANKKLIIVESPTKAKTINRFLGANSGCRIVASNGHIRTLPKTDMCIDLTNGYKPKYIIAPDKEKIITQLKTELKGADELILATDEDREGESISWHLLEVLKPKVPYRRMVFHEITKKAILEGLEHGRELDMNLVHAQEARRVLDRIYGYSVSPLLWSKLSNKSLSAGRVQSPGLRLIVDRERLRLGFKVSKYYEIKASFKEGLEARLDTYKTSKIATSQNFNSDSGLYEGKKNMILLNQELAKQISADLKEYSFYVAKIQEFPKTYKPLAPFTTSTLQQDANKKLHLSTKETMRIAQGLYENGFITYMRTDSPVLSEEGIHGARNAAASICGVEFVSPEIRRYTAKSESAQEAHEAIRPAGEEFTRPENTGLSGKELALYELIFKRTLACQMKDARKTTTSVTIKCDDLEDTYLVATGTRLDYAGYLKVYEEGKDDDFQEEKETSLPLLKEGQLLTLDSVSDTQHETKEPNRYTEASLVQKLEELGIGRPSTYSAIIDRLLEKEYVIKKGNALVPTFVGFGVIQLLEKNFSDLTGYEFTKQMEASLDQIAGGTINELQFLKDFYEGDDGLKKQIEVNKGIIDSKEAKTLRLPQLSEENVVKLGPYGPYVKNSKGDYVSIPKEWIPSEVTNEMVENLRNGEANSSDKKANGPVLLGRDKNSNPIFYCTGKFGDYWQLGDKSDSSAEVKRFRIPKSLLNQKVPVERILDYFSLPRIIGTTESGEEIIADIGKFGAYLKCGEDYRNLKDPEEIFSTCESEARLIFSQPKAGSKKISAKASETSKSAFVNDFGTVDGENLSIKSGKYGFYLKHGSKNIRIDAKYQHNEELCKAMTKEEALEYLKK